MALEPCSQVKTFWIPLPKRVPAKFSTLAIAHWEVLFWRPQTGYCLSVWWLQGAHRHSALTPQIVWMQQMRRFLLVTCHQTCHSRHVHVCHQTCHFRGALFLCGCGARQRPRKNTSNPNTPLQTNSTRILTNCKHSAQVWALQNSLRFGHVCLMPNFMRSDKMLLWIQKWPLYWSQVDLPGSARLLQICSSCRNVGPHRGAFFRISRNTWSQNRCPKLRMLSKVCQK